MTEQGLFANNNITKGSEPFDGGPSQDLEKSYQVPVLGMEAQGSCGGFGSPR
jgi:hypothetical protein